MEYTIQSCTSIPDFEVLGKWKELNRWLCSMEVGSFIVLTLPNQQEARNAQSIVQTGGTAREGNALNLRKKGWRFLTRTRPVNGNRDGVWNMWVERLA